MNLELIELYPSPFSERVRWVLEIKRLPYRRRSYQPLVGEAELREQTGQTTVPVFFADGELIGDSNAAVDWIETHQPAPPLLPTDPTQRLQVRAVELAATEALAPWARLGFILTRVDVTVAAMLATVFGHPPDDLFALEAPMRSMFGLPFGDDPAVAPLRRWRDDLYRRHRGGRVVPE